ncbi:MAG: magnesium transporter [Peptococcaceae bacterium BICA1-7]|nr:MAG: magnesium transporter [Peptococcaceae bacterium BICA1-7]HBV97246.1 magnesium and cobalt transport protein CorA [Desulfotomaculum sp.]
MPRLFKKRTVKTGLAPGSLVRVEGEREEVSITVLRYDEWSFLESDMAGAKDFFPPEKDDPTVTWVNVQGLPEPGVLKQLGGFFGLHPLVQEDILNTTDHRPKIEDYGDYLYITLKIIGFKKEDQEVDIEQVSLILGSNYVISIRERTGGNFFEPVRERITKGKGRIRKLKSDYLVYSILDLIVDNYFDVLESFGDMIDVLEDMFIHNPSQMTLKTFHSLKREILYLRKSVWPLREVVSSLERGDSELIGESLDLYLRDIYDHVTQIIDIIETFRDMLSEMLDIYLSSISNRINEVMKLLTIITILFIPLTFIAGVYGMNFRYMPELEWSWGYPAVMLVMGFIAIGMVFYFRKKRWL